jgi:hypothetical protein
VKNHWCVKTVVIFVTCFMVIMMDKLSVMSVLKVHSKIDEFVVLINMLSEHLSSLNMLLHIFMYLLKGQATC